MRILIVDDHPPTIELMRLTLASFGHAVSSATNVADALAMVAVTTPDLILSDLGFATASLPLGENPIGENPVGDDPLDGHDLARAVRARPDNDAIALVAITGNARPADRRAALESGFDDVVVKPFDVESLIERIDAIDRRRARPDQ